MTEAPHDPRETAIGFAGVALIAEALGCPMVKMDMITERLPDGPPRTSGVYATNGVPEYELASAPPHERPALAEANTILRARAAAWLGMAAAMARRVDRGESDPYGWMEEAGVLERTREEVAVLVSEPDPYLASETARVWDLLTAHWGAVEALAGALVREESLRGDRIRRIIRDQLRRERRPRIGVRKSRTAAAVTALPQPGPSDSLSSS